MPSLVWCLLQAFWQSEKHIRHFSPVNFLSSSKTSASKSEWIYIDSIDRTSLTYFPPKIREVHKRLWQYCAKKELKLHFVSCISLIGLVTLKKKLQKFCSGMHESCDPITPKYFLLCIRIWWSDHLEFPKRVTRHVRCIRFTYHKYQ